MAKGMWTVLNVSSIEKSVEFYKNLGLKARVDEMGPMRWGELNVGDTGLVFWPKDNLAPGQPADTLQWLSGELGKGVIFSIGVPNAEKVWQKAQQLRYDVDQPLREQEWGGKEFTLVDPDGYVVNFTDKFPGPAPKKKVARKAKAVAKKVKKATTKKKRR